MADLILINLTEPKGFTFQFYPSSVRISDRNNWQPQETTIGKKPLFYANREPRKITFDELYLDNSDTNESLTPQLESLLKLMEESSERGTPPPLLAVWSDREERVVLEELEIEEQLFNPDGAVIRAKIRLSLLEIQSDNSETSTSVQVLR